MRKQLPPEEDGPNGHWHWVPKEQREVCEPFSSLKAAAPVSLCYRLTLQAHSVRLTCLVTHALPLPHSLSFPCSHLLSHFLALSFPRSHLLSHFLALSLCCSLSALLTQVRDYLHGGCRQADGNEPTASREAGLPIEHGHSEVLSLSCL